MNDILFPEKINNDIKNVENFIAQRLELSNYKLKDNYLRLLFSGGKRIRPAFVFYSGQAFGGQTDTLLQMASAVELVHMSTLIHDDIIDHATKRRGEETLNAKHGDPWALYAGNYLFAEALEMIDSRKNPEIAGVMAEAAVKIVEGELLQQLALFDTSQTVRSYLKRIKGKTALLLALSCQIGALATTQNRDNIRLMYQYGYNLGMAFQIIDDILDMEDGLDLNKTKGQDLLYGHINLPAIFALQKESSEQRQLQAIIDRRFENENDLQEAVSIIKESGAVAKAKQVASSYSEKAKLSLEKLNNQSIKKELLKVSDSLIERNF